MGFISDFIEFLKELPYVIALILLEILYFFEDRVIRDKDPAYVLLFGAELVSIGSLALMQTPNLDDYLFFAGLFAMFIVSSVYLGKRKNEDDLIYPLQSTILAAFATVLVMMIRAALAAS
jgi:hypothetical protein